MNHEEENHTFATVGATRMFDGGRDAQVEWQCGYCNTGDFLVLSLRKTIKDAGRDLFEDQCPCCFNYQQIDAAGIASEAAHLVQNGTLGY